jgi:hypothetical protein
MDLLNFNEWGIDTHILKYISTSWTWLLGFLNSAFSSALFGALAGALTAQRIAEKSKTKELLLAEMKANNAAIAVTFGIVNSLISYKSQYYKPLKIDYEDAEYLYNETLVSSKVNPPSSPLTIPLNQNFITLQEIKAPTDILEKYIFEKLTLDSWSLFTTNSLFESLQSLNEVIAIRNAYILTLPNDPIYQQYKAEVYFGYDIPQLGIHNSKYKHLVYGIIWSADDAIFFGMFLIQLLKIHGQKLHDNYKNKYKVGAIKPLKPDFDKAARRNLLPHPIDYLNWLAALHTSSSENKESTKSGLNSLYLLFKRKET